jgi:predicted Zn-dependent protease
MKTAHLLLLRLSAIILLAGFLNSCATNPVTGKKEFMLLSKEQEVKMGISYDPQVVANYGLYEDQKIQQFITTQGRLMARISHRPELPYEFKVLDSPVVNAFAVPGGFVYFTRGIMAHFNNEAEFAGVLGHEIGHVTARHSARQYSRQMLGQVGLIAGIVVSPKFAQFADAASQGLGLLFLKYGRDAESESDRLGVEYSTKIGYDATEMAEFFQTLKRLSDQGGGRLPTFLSSHPDPANRYDKTKALAQKWQQRYSGRQLKVGRDSYLRMIDGLLYGEDPRQGYVERNTFYHPELKFQYPIPNGWRTVNTPSQVQMAPEDGNAVMVFSLSTKNNLTQAEQAYMETHQFDVTSRNNRQVNGLNARVVQGRQIDEQNQQAINILLYFIEHGGRVYQLLGMAYQQQYANYESNFLRTMNGFDRLSDASKINVQPERIKIVEAPRTTNLRSVLSSNGIPGSRLEEFSILNGMELNSQVQKGTLIKVVDKAGN